MGWSQKELDEEYRVTKSTRLGLLCEDRVPTAEQEQMAHVEARTLISRLRINRSGLQQLIDFGENL